MLAAQRKLRIRLYCLGQKIVTKEGVSKHDLTDPENCKVYLGHSICCNFGDLSSVGNVRIGTVEPEGRDAGGQFVC